jgi:putative salt-induced outer membrane protein YdiY
VTKRFFGIVLLVVPVSAAAGQSPGASESLQEPTTAQMIASSPQPGERGVQATAGFQIQEGPTSTKAFSINFIAAHTLENRDLARFDLEIGRAYYKASSAVPYLKVEDNFKAQNIYLHIFKKRWAAMGSAYYRRDSVIELDYRTYLEGGIGVQAIETRRVKLLTGVGYAVGRESRKFLPEAEKVLAVGFMDSLVIILSPSARIEQWLQYHADTSRSADRSYALNASLVSRISRHAGVKVYYQRQYDALHPVTVPKLQSEFGAGLSISFQPPPRGTAKP